MGRMAPETEFLVREFMTLASSIAASEAAKMGHREPEDIRSSALLGLVDAASRWADFCRKTGSDPANLKHFKNYASMRIRGEMIEYIRRNSPMCKEQVRDMRRIEAAGPSLTSERLSEVTGLSRKRISQLMALRSSSLTRVEADDSPGIASVEGTFETGDLLGAVSVMISNMDQDARIVLALRYYLGLRMPEIAKAVGLPSSVVSGVHRDAVIMVHEYVTEHLGVKR